MTFEVEVGGRTRTIVVERTDRSGRFRVIVDGQPHVIDVTRTGDFVLSVLKSVPLCPVMVAKRRQSRAPIAVTSRFAGDRDYADGGTRPAPGDLQGRTATVTVNGRRTGHAADAGAHSPGRYRLRP